jgi:hypothetical protein
MQYFYFQSSSGTEFGKHYGTASESPVVKCSFACTRTCLSLKREPLSVHAGAPTHEMTCTICEHAAAAVCSHHPTARSHLERTQRHVKRIGSGIHVISAPWYLCGIQRLAARRAACLACVGPVALQGWRISAKVHQFATKCANCIGCWLFMCSRPNGWPTTVSSGSEHSPANQHRTLSLPP